MHSCSTALYKQLRLVAELHRCPTTAWPRAEGTRTASGHNGTTRGNQLDVAPRKPMQAPAIACGAGPSQANFMQPWPPHLRWVRCELRITARMWCRSCPPRHKAEGRGRANLSLLCPLHAFFASARLVADARSTGQVLEITLHASQRWSCMLPRYPCFVSNEDESQEALTQVKLILSPRMLPDSCRSMPSPGRLEARHSSSATLLLSKT